MYWIKNSATRNPINWGQLLLDCQLNSIKACFSFTQPTQFLRSQVKVNFIEKVFKRFIIVIITARASILKLESFQNLIEVEKSFVSVIMGIYFGQKRKIVTIRNGQKWQKAEKRIVCEAPTGSIEPWMMESSTMKGFSTTLSTYFIGKIEMKFGLWRNFEFPYELKENVSKAFNKSRCETNSDRSDDHKSIEFIN